MPNSKNKEGNCAKNICKKRRKNKQTNGQTKRQLTCKSEF